MEQHFVPNEMNEELSGIHGLNFSFPNNSSPRSVMFGSHFSQRLVVEGADHKIIQTGMEYEMSKYTFDIKMPVDAIVQRVIPRYPKTYDVDSINFSPETLVIYEDIKTGEIGALTIPYYQSFHQYFGFKNVFRQQNLEKLVPGNIIEKGTVFATSNSVGDNGGFKYGVPLNTALMSHPATSEDGVLISRSALKKLQFSIFETRVIEFGGKSVPLNIYGDLQRPKFFPEIGEEIKDNGVIMMLRKTEPYVSPAELSIYDISEPDFTFDTAYYARGPGGRVVDIKVYYNPEASNPLPKQMTEGFMKYVKGYRNFYQEIINTEQQIRNDRKKKFGVDNTTVSPYLHLLLRDGYAILDPFYKKYGGKKINLAYRKAPLPEMRVVFTIEYQMTPDIGFKITDSHG